MSKPKKIVRQDGSVVYRIVYDAGHDPDTGKRKQITRTFDRKKDADAELARVTHQRATGAYVVPSKLTLDRMLDEFLVALVAGIDRMKKCLRIGHMNKHGDAKPSAFVPCRVE